MPESQSSEQLFDLASNRVILLHDRDRVFTVTCRRPGRENWTEYFQSISITSEQRGAERISTLDLDSPLVGLAERVLSGAEGYSVAGGGKLTDLPNWPSRLPLAHRRAIGAALADVRPSAPTGDFVIQPEGEEVLLDAFWSAAPLDGERWGSVKLAGLKHIFKSPTQAQHKRYNQESSRSVVTGGSRTGRTVYTGAQTVLCDLYDELIVTVEGYCFSELTLAAAEDARTYMDLHHKFTAAQELFAPAAAVTTEADAE